MGHYIANVRDLEFNIFEVLEVDAVLGAGQYSELDADTVRTILSEAARLAEGPVAETFAFADRNPPVFDPDTHTISVAPELAKTVQAIKDAEWWRLGLAEEIGGMPAPPPLAWAVNEMIFCANPSASFYCLGPFMAQALYAEGNEEQKRWAAEGVERGWAATMVLTELDAGSDVGAGRSKAIEQPDGTWHIEGVKRFISGGDVGDTADNVFHLVLARPEGAGPGTKGLSLFYVPNYLFDPDTFELGARNGVFVTGLEHKMGIKSSPTCELTFGATDVPAVGYLVGGVHNGIAQMFTVIEHARMTIGVKAAGTLSTGYLNALAYAKERVQGADLTQMTDKTAPRVTIMHHPDVRRSLMTQKAYAEGLRALYMYAAAHQDDALAQQVSGADHEMAHRVDDLLLPIVKGVSSERAYEILTESLQTLGGSGFLQDYPLEQYIRDSKIDSLYEGTTAIQALDFVLPQDRPRPRRGPAVRDRSDQPDHRRLRRGAEISSTGGAIRARRGHGDDGRVDRLPDVRDAASHGDLQGGTGFGALSARGRRPADRLAVAGGRGRRTRRTGRRPRRSGQGVLPGQDRDVGVLRHEHATETFLTAPHHRIHRRRRDAASRRGVLSATASPAC